MTRLLIAAMWLLHWLPYRWQAALGNILGTVLYLVVVPRRRVILRNLALCFPHLSEAERCALGSEHVRLWVRTFLDRGLLWFAPRERLEHLIKIEGLEYFEAARSNQTGRAWMIFAPHFVGLDAAGIAVILRQRAASVYVQPTNPVFERQMLAGRARFEGSEQFSRSDGIRPVVKVMKRGLPFFIMPDMDLGKQDSVFVDFFRVPAATVTALPRLARLTDAVVLPLIVRLNDDNTGYTVRFYPPWTDYPGQMDDQAGARAMNAFIEDRVREMPAQYYWVHRRFKTRPEGTPKIY
ncbi:MAG: lysophospholipid acyltransferase family protein [Burkholderiales bacterium]|jgi:KDO2-lipid IV(A) lauroyltransferase